MHSNRVIRFLAKQQAKRVFSIFRSNEEKNRTKEMFSSHDSSRCRQSNYKSFVIYVADS